MRSLSLLTAMSVELCSLISIFYDDENELRVKLSVILPSDISGEIYAEILALIERFIKVLPETIYRDI